MEQLLSMLREEFRKMLREEIQIALKEVPNKDCWMNTKELCEYLGVSRSWVSHRLDKLPHTKEPLRFRKTEVDKWLNEQVQNEIEDKLHMDANLKLSGKKKYRVV